MDLEPVHHNSRIIIHSHHFSAIALSSPLVLTTHPLRPFCIADDARGDLDGTGAGQSAPHSWHSTTLWYRLNKVITRLCSTHQFKNLQVEMLYQRYFLRMNQNNTTHIVSLLLALVLLLGGIHIIFALIAASSPTPDIDPSVASLQVVGKLSSARIGGDAPFNDVGATSTAMWDNGTTTKWGGGVDNNNITILSSVVGDGNMTATWDAQNDTVSATGDTSPLPPNKMWNFFGTNILPLVITLGVCGTICIREYMK